MRQIYTVRVDSAIRYHGISAVDALEALNGACEAKEGPVAAEVQRTPWPHSEE